jgi:pimeloyl-ACP methyl ester carboxylesterase
MNDGSQTAALGALVLHGKAGTSSGHISGVVSALLARGYPVSAPDMPWASERIYEVSYEDCMREIDREVEALQRKGASAVVVVGHSLGANVAVGYGARSNRAAGIVALAPGHYPEQWIFLQRLGAEVDRARSLVAAGKGGERQRFADFNQGELLEVSATPEIYLSWLDPSGPAVMPRNAAAFKSSTPLLVVVGAGERSAFDRDYFFDKAPSHPKSRFVSVQADHFDVPKVAIDELMSWLETLQR